MKFAIGHRIPFFNRYLFGDRKKFGLVADRDHPMWKEWENICSQFYRENQRSGAGKLVNDAGYKILDEFDFENKVIVEIRPGRAPHLSQLKSKPSLYILVDIREDFLVSSARRLNDMGINVKTHLVSPDKIFDLPIEKNSADLVLTFYSLEHLSLLKEYINEYKRILKKEGWLIGVIPAEGALAWGIGRFFTSRKWLKNNSSIDPDKLICWEHTNFSDYILKKINESFDFKRIYFWPLRFPFLDTNLVFSFIAKVK